jgi:hypothetical protein
MPWPRPVPELVALLDEAVKPFPAERKTMFGCPAYFVNGNMFAGVFAASLFVRLPADLRAKATTDWGEGATFEPVAGRPMREYVVLPPAVTGDGATLAGWLATAHQFAAATPPKAAKPRRKA